MFLRLCISKGTKLGKFMTEVRTNYGNYNVGYQKTNVKQNQTQPRPQITIKEYYRRETRKNNGLVERFHNWLKNITGVGVGSKKVLAELEKAEKGESTVQDLQAKIQEYNASQENSAQLFGDAVSISASGATFFGLNKLFKQTKGCIDVNKPLTDNIASMIKKTREELANDTKISAKKKKFNNRLFNIYEKTFNTLKSNKKTMLITALASAYVGGLTKYWALKFNRIDSNEFKVDEKIYGSKKLRNPMQKEAAKLSKKQLNKERRKTNFKNFVSGTINGLMMPVMALGGIVGAPIYLVGNMLNRYFVANKTDKNKSANGLMENLSSNALSIGLVTTALAVPLFKKGNFAKVFNENMAKASKKLAEAKLKPADFKGMSAYKQLEGTMLESPNIKAIIDSSANIEDKIKQLTKENLFAVKFKQISADGSELTAALREKCPPTRSLEEAQKYITSHLGGGYKVSKLLGVGTVAETYLAKNASGKEVCIKILKDGITKDKILNDKQKFIDMVKNMSDKSADEKDYLLRNVEDLADGILKEVNLKNEMDAALKLSKTTKVANVVKPIEVKNNVYVMEKANGVSLSSFMDLNKLYLQKEAVNKLVKDATIKENELKKIDEEIKRVTERMPDFSDIKLRKSDTDYLLQEYRKVFIEQFHKIDKNGKVIHADIHPGNIFIDPNVLKTRRGKLFTLIDTGNTIDMGVDQSLRALNLTSYIKQGNVKDIAEYVLEGAKLPTGMDKNGAIDKVENELKACFFDNSTKLEQMNDEKILTLTDNIMQKYDIIPSSSQLNLHKSRTSAKNSLKDLENAIMDFDFVDVMGHHSSTGKVLAGGKKGLEHLARNKIYDSMVARQEKENLKQLTPMQKLKQKNNPNAPRSNSEDYLTYWLKQKMLGDVKLD